MMKLPIHHRITGTKQRLEKERTSPALRNIETNSHTNEWGGGAVASVAPPVGCGGRGIFLPPIIAYKNIIFTREWVIGVVGREEGSLPHQ